MNLLGELAVLVVASLLGGLLALRLRQPLVLGYLIAGVVVGPFGLALIRDPEAINFLAELGVALLLFALGIQFSFRELLSVGRLALLGTPLQVLATMAFGYLLGQLFGWGPTESLWFGAIIALSNTMVTLATLMSRGLLGTLSSRVMVAMLIVQDLLTIPLIIILPQLDNLEAGLPALLGAGLHAALFLALMVIVGTRLIPGLLMIAARWGSRELFLLTVAAAGLGVGLATQLFGLSFAFGAFAAGMVISESDYSYQALSDIIPLRDLFSLVFFASIGMLLDPTVLISEWQIILIIVALVVIGKSLIMAVITRTFGYGNIIPLAVGLTLFQLGEFSFVLAAEGLRNGAISPNLYAIILNVAILTLILTPIISRLADPLYRLRQRFFKHEPLSTVNIPSDGLREHVIIIGHGRTGQHVVRTMQQFDLPFVVIELDQRRFQDCKSAGVPVIYGDAAQGPVLETAGIAHARLLLDTVPSETVTRAIYDAARHLNPEMHIVARVEGVDQMKSLHDHGLYELVQPHFEAGLEITRQALLHMDVQPFQVYAYLDGVRRLEYAPLYEVHPEHTTASALQVATNVLRLHWIDIPANSPVAGQTLAETHIRSRTGVSVAGIVRDGNLMPNPGPLTRLEPGDVLALLGEDEQIAELQRMLGSWAYPLQSDSDHHTS